MNASSAAPVPWPARGRRALLVALGASLVLHALLVVALARLGPPPSPRSLPVSVEIVETSPPPRTVEPPPPEPPRAPASPPRPVRPRPSVVDPRAPARSDVAPPPPSAPADRPTPAPEVRFGVSMSTTTEAGSAAAPVGNSLYGKPPERATEPRAAKPYAAERYAEASSLSSLPQPIAVDVPRSEYPPEAAREGIEGAVKLRLVVDEEGRVREATVVSDPGHGLGPAAVRAARRWFRFRPARKDGVAVATEIPFTVEFELR